VAQRVEAFGLPVVYHGRSRQPTCPIPTIPRWSTWPPMSTR
jgi:hypothetical protein